MRHGFTTGSCAAAAAKAAAYMLLFETEKQKIEILTPKGIVYQPEILQITRGENFVQCGVRKDGGDDPDVTTGAMVFARVSFLEEGFHMETAVGEKPINLVDGVNHGFDGRIVIDGGEGVGRVTKPGLDQPVGAAAINHVPREMIRSAVTEVCELADFKGRLKVVISVPGGEEIARQTFNPRLGIVGGISIIGTSGIVEPMSMKAILDTIGVELSQRKAEGYSYVATAPGNYGRDYMKEAWHYDIDRSVKCSNFIGDTIDMAAELGFQGLLLTGHIGKLVKLAGGIMNTHSREGDCRMELMAAAAMKEGVESRYILQILDSVVTEEAIRILEESGKRQAVMERLMERIMFYLQKRAGGRMEIECVIYSNEFGELARSEGAEKWLTLLAQEQAQSI